MTASDRTLFDVNGDGFMIFEGLSLKLRADVFVPRGESRHLIHAATRSLDKVETTNLPFHVLYVCEKPGQMQMGTNMSCLSQPKRTRGTRSHASEESWSNILITTTFACWM